MPGKLCRFAWAVAAVCAGVRLDAAPDRIVRKVDPNRATVVRGQMHRWARPQYDQGPADPSLPIRYVTLLLKPAAGLGEFLNTQGKQRLRPEEFADRFGLSTNDIGRITAWLTSQGLQVNDVARGHHWITFSGTAEQIGRAMHTEIHRYRVNGKLHFANATEPSVPQALEGVVAGFRGLNDFRAAPHVITAPLRASSTGAEPQYNAGGLHYLAPGDLATIYDFAPLLSNGTNGSGVTIVIPGQTDILTSDLTEYRQLFGLPVNTPVQKLFGPDPSFNVGDLEEASLDLEIAGAAAPGATIVYANSIDVFLSLQYAIDQNLGQVISVSYGVCELDESTGFQVIAQQANAQGITVMAGSGDSGAADCDQGNPTPQASTGPTLFWPGNIPEITSVGGTEFNSSGSFWSNHNSVTGGSALSYVPETAWNDSAALNYLAAGGGGASLMFPKPPWQAGPGVPNDNARDEPDVSLAASILSYPYLFVVDGQELTGGGTSAASPLFAGIVALFNQYLVANGTLTQPGLGNINPALYRLAQSVTSGFHDITTGNNAVPCAQSTTGCVGGFVGYSAGPGYDLATGLGSVDAFNLVTHWSSGSASTTSLALSPQTAGLTDSVQLTATVQGSGAAPTGTVSFLVDGAGALGEASVATATLTAGSAAGTAMASVILSGSQLAFGDGALLAVYSGDTIYPGSHGSAAFTLKLPASGGSLVIPFATPDPVPQSPNGEWLFAVGLTEVSGTATTLTGFSINGVAQSLIDWSSTTIPGFGNIYTSITETQLSAPGSLLLSFSGRDASGRTWTQQLSVPYTGYAGAIVQPSILLTTATPTVLQNPNAPPACEWSQQLGVEETGGFETLLETLLVNGQNFSSQIQTTFGTTRLAPYGYLQGNLCVASVGPTTILLRGIAESGQSEGVVVGSTVTTTLQTAAAAAAASWTSPAAGASYALNAATSSQVPAPAAIPVSFSTGSPSWTVSVGPVNPASSWLSVAPLSGTGPGSVTVSASATGLSPGAYTAVLTFASTGTSPQAVSVVVTLTVGSAGSTSIAGLVNNFSGSLTAAPGMIAGVYGSQMAPPDTSASAPGLPLPLTLAGVSATVNGVTAPLYYVSPGQIDLQIPYETAAGTVVLAINNNGQIATFAFPVAVTAPGLFASAVSNSTGASVSSASADQTLLLFMTGEGDVTPTLATGASPTAENNPNLYPKPRQPVAVSVGGVPASIAFQGIPAGLAGVTQIDFLIPPNAPLGAQQVVVMVGGVASPPVNLTIAP